MNLTSRVLDAGVLIIDCQEENLDASNVAAFRAAVQEVLKGQTRVVLNMSKMKFVDSSGLGALISCLRETNSHKGDFRLCAMTRSVRALFELMRMHRVFSIFDTEDDAIASFA